MGDSTGFKGRPNLDAPRDDAETKQAPLARPRDAWELFGGDRERSANKPRGAWNWVNEQADALRIGDEGVGGRGGMLPHKEAIQKSFGRHDISGIEAHSDRAAEAAAGELAAKAYAKGNHVAFGSSPSLHTAAHEAAHVVQHNRGSGPLGAVDGGPGTFHEQHANAVAEKVVRGESAESLLDQVGTDGAGPPTESVQREPLKQGPGAAITVSLLDRDKKFITAVSVPLYSVASSGTHVGRIAGGAIVWDGEALQGVKLGDKIVDGHPVGGEELESWISHAGKGRAFYVLVYIDGLQESAKASGNPTAPFDDETRSGLKPRSSNSHNSTEAKQSGQTAPFSDRGQHLGATEAIGTGNQASGDDTATHDGAQVNQGHDGKSDQVGEKAGTREKGSSSHGSGDGSRFGQHGAEKHEVGAFWNPDLPGQGLQDSKAENADRDGMVGGEGKIGDHGTADVGALWPHIPVPQRIKRYVNAGVILSAVNVKMIAESLVKAVAKAGIGEAKVLVEKELESLTEKELANLTSKPDLARLTDSEIASATKTIRDEAKSKLRAEMDAIEARAQKAKQIENPTDVREDVVADAKKENEAELRAAKEVKSALSELDADEAKTARKNTATEKIDEGSPKTEGTDVDRASTSDKADELAPRNPRTGKLNESERVHVEEGDFTDGGKHTGGGHGQQNFAELEKHGYVELDPEYVKAQREAQAKFDQAQKAWQRESTAMAQWRAAQNKRVKALEQIRNRLKNPNLSVEESKALRSLEKEREHAVNQGVAERPAGSKKPVPADYGLENVLPDKFYTREALGDPELNAKRGSVSSKNSIHTNNGHTWFPPGWDSQTVVEVLESNAVGIETKVEKTLTRRRAWLKKSNGKFEIAPPELANPQEHGFLATVELSPSDGGERSAFPDMDQTSRHNK